MFILAFFVGFLVCLIFVVIGYIIFREVIFKYGKFVRRKIEDEINLFDDATKRNTEIVYPDIVTETFKKEDSTLSDLIKN